MSFAKTSPVFVSSGARGGNATGFLMFVGIYTSDVARLSG